MTAPSPGSAPHARTFTSDFKRFFLRGLVVLLPSVLTLWIVVKAYQFVDTTIAEPINRGVRLTMAKVTPFYEPMQTAFDPTDDRVQAVLSERQAQQRRATAPAVIAELRQEKINQWWAERWYMNLIGLMIAIVAVYTAGRVLGGFFGRRIYWRLEGLLTSVPVIKQVYPYIKQIVDFLFSDDQPMKFNRVVAVEYPRKGIWSVGFMTGPAMRDVSARLGSSVTVFIPSSPTPFTGYTITVQIEDVIELPMTVEEAIRFAVSGGVLIPENQAPPDDGRQVMALPEPAEPAESPETPDSPAAAPAKGRAMPPAHAFRAKPPAPAAD